MCVCVCGGGGGGAVFMFLLFLEIVIFLFLLFFNIALKMLLLPYFLFSQLIFKGNMIKVPAHLFPFPSFSLSSYFFRSFSSFHLKCPSTD